MFHLEKLDSALKYMNEEQIRQIAKDVYNELGTKFGVASVPAHIHDGVDTNQITQKNVIQNPCYATFITENVSETFTITNVPNLRQATFTGIAYDSSATPATKKGLVTGTATFDNTFSIVGAGTTVFPDTSIANAYVQTANCIYVDTSALNKTTVSTVGGTTTGFIVRVENDLAAVVASLQIISYFNGVLAITSSVATNWIIKGSLILT